MPHVIADRDFGKPAKANAEKLPMEGMVSDAMEGLRMLRDKYGL